MIEGSFILLFQFWDFVTFFVSSPVQEWKSSSNSSFHCLGVYVTLKVTMQEFQKGGLSEGTVQAFVYTE